MFVFKNKLYIDIDCISILDAPKTFVFEVKVDHSRVSRGRSCGLSFGLSFGPSVGLSVGLSVGQPVGRSFGLHVGVHVCHDLKLPGQPVGRS